MARRGESYSRSTRRCRRIHRRERFKRACSSGGQLVGPGGGSVGVAEARCRACGWRARVLVPVHSCRVVLRKLGPSWRRQCSTPMHVRTSALSSNATGGAAGAPPAAPQCLRKSLSNAGATAGRRAPSLGGAPPQRRPGAQGTYMCHMAPAPSANRPRRPAAGGPPSFRPAPAFPGVPKVARCDAWVPRNAGGRYPVHMYKDGRVAMRSRRPRQPAVMLGMRLVRSCPPAGRQLHASWWERRPRAPGSFTKGR